MNTNYNSNAVPSSNIITDSIDVLDYIEMDGHEEMNSPRLSSPAQFRANKIKMKTGISLIRISILTILYYFENQTLTPLLTNLISFLLLHEVMVIANFMFLFLYYFISHLLNTYRPTFPSFCTYIDVLNNFIFFIWFLYGNICILTDHVGVEDSLEKNRLMTYYIICLILLGFFVFSKLIFYVIFFISFCPCITYVLCFDLHEEYQNSRKAQRLQERLQGELYSAYRERCGYELDMCIICALEFTEDSRVVSLPCNDKHVFHSECIKKWVEKKTVCPLCRVEINA